MASDEVETAARVLIGEQLKGKAAWVHERLSLAKSVGTPFGEETITETLLLDLQVALGVRLHVKTFTKWVESRTTGADWEWWFCDGAGSPMFGMRVQAKKLKLLSGVPSYDFAYKPRLSKKRQVDRLIEDADRAGLPAVYALYNGPELDLNLFDWNCCFESPSPHLFGVSLIGATSAKRLANDKDLSIHTAGALSRPWSCSVLCPKRLRMDKANIFWPDGTRQLSVYVADLVTDLLANEAEAQEGPWRQSALAAARGFRAWNEGPTYVQRIVEDMTAGDLPTDRPEDEVEPSGLGGVVVFLGDGDLVPDEGQEFEADRDSRDEDIH